MLYFLKKLWRKVQNYARHAQPSILHSSFFDSVRTQLSAEKVMSMRRAVQENGAQLSDAGWLPRRPDQVCCDFDLPACCVM